MSETTQDWYIAERGRTLARLHLTRRGDLDVEKAGPGIGLEYVVSILKVGEPSLRQFGVFLGGSKTATTEEDLDKLLRPKMRSFLRLGPFPYPVCLFHFTMDGDQGYFTWVAEPTVTEDEPQLLMHEAAHCRKLDRAVLDEIVRKVDHWYDVFFGRIVVKAS
jgi:hypothetical protein